MNKLIKYLLAAVLAVVGFITTAEAGFSVKRKTSAAASQALMAIQSATTDPDAETVETSTAKKPFTVDWAGLGVKDTKGTYVMLVNERTGNSIAIETSDDGETKTELPPLALAELERQYLGANQKFRAMAVTCTAQGKEEVVDTRLVASSGAGVVLPNFSYLDAGGQLKKTTVSDRRLVSLGKTSPSFIMRNPDNAKQQKAQGRLQAEHAYYQYTYELPNGDKTVYSEPMLVGSEQPIKEFASNGSQLTFELYGSFPEAAKNAHAYALTMWSAALRGTIPVRIRIDMFSFSAAYPDEEGMESVIGCSYSPPFWLLDNGMAFPEALFQQLVNQDMSGTSAYDIRLEMNTDMAFYYGIDGNCPDSMVDYVTIVLHEVCHGLGFMDSIAPNGALSLSDGTYSYPLPYDYYLVYNGKQIYNQGASVRKTAITSDNLYFGGDTAYEGNGGSMPKLFAPAYYMSGSSVSHWDWNVTFPTFMRYAYDYPLHQIGPQKIGAMEDLGWDISGGVIGLPAVPQAIFATQGTQVDKVSLSWGGVGGATSYKVKRATSKTGTYDVIASNIKTLKYDDANTSGSQHYFYKVCGVNDAGDGGDSAAVEGWAKSSTTLSSVEVDGPATLSATAEGTYTCTAIYSDGSRKDVSNDSGTTWTVPYGKNYVTQNGNKLTAASLTTSKTVTLRATYGGKSDEYTVTIVPRTVKVTFNANGGVVSPSSQEYIVDSTYGSFPTPTRTDYDFLGWYDAASGGNKIETTTKVTGSITQLFAHWEFHVKTVKVWLTGDTSVSTGQTFTVTCHVKDNLGSTKDPATVNWLVETDGGHWTKKWTDANPMVQSSRTPGSVSIKAVCDGITSEAHTVEVAIKEETVTFNPNGGSVSPARKTFTVGVPYGELPTPTYSGHDFDGWYTKLSGGTLVTAATVCNVGITTLYAHWTKHVELDHIEVTGPASVISGAVGSYVCTAYFTDSSSQRVAAPQWNTDLGSIANTGAFTAPTVTETKVATITASYTYEGKTKTATMQVTVNPKTVTVTFNANGGTVSPSSKSFVIGLAYGTLPNPSRSDNDFNGWFTQTSGGAQITKDTICDGKVTVLYARWKPHITVTSLAITGPASVVSGATADYTFTATFNNGNSEKVTPDSCSANYGALQATGKFTAPSVTTETNVKLSASYMDAYGNSKSATLTIKVTPKKINVAFDANGGSATPAQKEYVVGLPYGSLASATWTDHNFLGWYTSKTGGSRVDESTVCKEGTATLYARWQPIVKLTSLVISGPDEVTSLESITNSCTGYYSDGTHMTVTPVWTANKGVIFEDGVYFAPTVTVATVVRLTATLSSVSTFKDITVNPRKVTVEFDANGEGAAVDPESKEYTVWLEYGDLPTPNWDGYEFDGWFTEPTGGDPVTEETECAEEITELYAHWTKKVVLDHLVIVGADSVVSGGELNYTCEAHYSDGTVQGNVSAAWTVSKGSVTSSGSFTAPMVTATTVLSITATYQSKAATKNVTVSPKQQSVTFNANGGTVSPSSKAYTVGLAYGSLPTPTRSGDYRFVGWYTNAKSGAQVTEATVCTEAVSVLYARWEFVKKLDSIVIGGEDEVVSGREVEFTCTAYYNDGTSLEASGVEWGVTAGEIDANGVFTAPLVTAMTRVTISASYTSDGETKTAAKSVKVNPIALRVTLDANGGTVDPDYVDCVVGLPYGLLPVPTWEGEREHAFDGWFASTEATNRFAVTEDTIAIEAVTNLVAAWHEVVKFKDITIECPLTVVSEGSAKCICRAEYTDGSSNDVSSAAVWEIGRGDEFATIDAEGRVTAGKVTANQTILIYASFGGVTKSISMTIVPKKVTVTFLPHEGLVSPSSKEYVVGLPYGSFPAASRQFYRFQGWFTDAVGGTRIMESDVADENTTVLHAQWLENPPALKSLAIRGASSVNGGGSSAYYCVATWTNGISETTSTLTSSEVDWSVDPASAGTVVDGVFSPVRVRDDLNVTIGATYQDKAAEIAVTVKAERITVAFNANGGTVSEASRICSVGFAYGELPIPTRENFRFDGWFTAASGGLMITGATICEKGISVLYAQWTEIPHLTGLIIVGDGVVTSGVASVYQCRGVYSDDSEVLVSPDWSVEFPDQGVIDEDGVLVAALVPETTNLFVVASFEDQTNAFEVVVEPQMVSVFFDPQNGAVAPQRVEYVVGSPYGELPVPMRSKYVFDGWYTREAKAGECVAEETTADADVTVLYAGWTPEASALTGIRVDGVSKVASGGVAQFSCTAIHTDGTETSVSPQWSIVAGTDWGLIMAGGFFIAETVPADKVVTIRAAYTEKGIRYEDEHEVVVTTSALVVDPEAISLESGAQTATLMVDAIGNWTVSTDVDWITLKKTSGSEIDTVDFTVTANGETEERYGTITVICGALVETCEVKQYSAIPDEYVTVSLDPQVDGQEVSTRQYIRGRKFGYLPTPVRTGFAFGGWWTRPGGLGTQCHPLTIVTDETLKLYAYWSNMTVGYALNNALDWVQDSAHPWGYDYSVSADRKLSMCSPMLGNNQSSSLSALVEGPGTISFYWKASSEEFFDTLTFYVDGRFVASISGETAWKMSSQTIQGFGQHVLTWTYAKDGQGIAGADCGWLDLVTWMPNYSGSGASSISSADGKSLPESWINAYGLEATSSVVNEDADGDGMTNYEEYKAMTDPLDPESCFKVFIELDVDGKPNVDVISGREYTLEGKVDLDDEKWEPADRNVHKFFRAIISE